MEQIVFIRQTYRGACGIEAHVNAQAQQIMCDVYGSDFANYINAKCFKVFFLNEYNTGYKMRHLHLDARNTFKVFQIEVYLFIFYEKHDREVALA